MLTSKSDRIAEGLQNALDMSHSLNDDTSAALEALRASVRGLITFLSVDEDAPQQQLCASIRKASKYAYQADALPADRQFFPVRIRPDLGGYCVVGGPGGAYRLTDVHLHAMYGDRLVKLN